MPGRDSPSGDPAFLPPPRPLPDRPRSAAPARPAPPAKRQRSRPFESRTYLKDLPRAGLEPARALRPSGF